MEEAPDKSPQQAADISGGSYDSFDFFSEEEAAAFLQEPSIQALVVFLEDLKSAQRIRPIPELEYPAARLEKQLDAITNLSKSKRTYLDPEEALYGLTRDHDAAEIALNAEDNGLIDYTPYDMPKGNFAKLPAYQIDGYGLLWKGPVQNFTKSGFINNCLALGEAIESHAAQNPKDSFNARCQKIPQDCIDTALEYRPPIASPTPRRPDTTVTEPKGHGMFIAPGLFPDHSGWEH